MRHAVIMAGGAGKRLWPMSRQSKPKHFLKLVEGKSLMRLAFERISPLIPNECIHVITGAHHLQLVRQELPELPEDNLIGEPAVRDTANAIALSALLIHQKDPKGTMGVFTADHVIEPMRKFHEALDRAYATAETHPDALVTIGIKPTQPHTGYGYVHRGTPISDSVFEVSEFKEKPDAQAASQYVHSGEYYWNSGMFTWQLKAILSELEKHLPENYHALHRIANAPDRDSRHRLLEQLYPTVKKISIDFGVMEKARRVLTCEMDCRWIDVGSWTSLAELLSANDTGQIHLGASVITLESNNNILVGEQGHLLAAIGIEDLVVVQTPDATLICHRSKAQNVKALVDQLESRYL